MEDGDRPGGPPELNEEEQATLRNLFIISVLDDYSSQIDRTTVIVLDNASRHTSAAFCDRLETGAERGLLVYHIPPYSPELNTIELLWKKLKY